MTSDVGSSKRDTIFPGSDGEALLLSLDSKRLRESQSLQEPHTIERHSKRSRTLVKGGTDTGLLDLYLPSKHSSRKSNSENSTQWLEGSPWISYEKAYRVELGGSVAVAHRKPNTGKQFTVRSLSATDDEMRLILGLEHENLLCPYEVFKFEGAFYTISEHMAVSLNHFIGCDEPPSEGQLASVASQCLGAISYLASKGLIHTEFTCRNVLVSLNGVVKIAKLEQCRDLDQEEKVDITAFGRVIWCLMEKSFDVDRNFGIQDLTRWSENAVNFLSMTVDSTLEELLSHPFLECARIEDLPWFVFYAIRKARTIVSAI